MRTYAKPAAGLPAPRFVRPLHRPCPDEPGPSRSPRRRGADRDGGSRAVRRAADGSRPRVPQNRGTA
ncbi:hypothetical protein ACFVZC_01840 [Streptomyces marokkonensis]|uniref:Uncharacterized protein n=1 Tax=Streptomyces marokkonensis TaxID=324855 RepID=A0ABW6PZ14_9ACTN